MAEAQEVESTAASTTEATESTELETQVETTTEEVEREPGGDTPEQIRARKEYRLRKRTEQERDAERIRIARLEGENEALRQQKPKDDEKKVFTIAEINAAVERNEITRVDADRYIDQVIIPSRIDERLKVREQEREQLQPVQKAESEIEQYKQYLPELTNKADQKFIAVAAKYRELVAGGLPQSIVTERVAVEMVHGSLDKLKKKAEIEAATRERGAGLMPVDQGGGNPRPVNGKVDVSKAPAHLVAYWDRTGTDQKTRESEMAYWVKKNKK